MTYTGPDSVGAVVGNCEGTGVDKSNARESSNGGESELEHC